jgi:hypothetical protein
MKIRSRTSLTIALCVSVVSITAVGTWATKRQQSTTGAQVENSLRVLQITSVNETPLGNGLHRVLKLSIKNISDKNVVAYVLLNKNGSSMTNSGAPTGWVLAPGETDETYVSVNWNEELPRLFAALLEDGTGDGDPREVAWLRDYHIGTEKQFRRALPFLNEAKNAPASAQASAVLNNLRERLAALPEKDAEVTSHRMESGLHSAKEFIIKQLDPVAEKLKDNSSLEVRRVQGDFEQLILRIEAALKKLQGVRSAGGSTSQVR